MHTILNVHVNGNIIIHLLSVIQLPRAVSIATVAHEVGHNHGSPVSQLRTGQHAEYTIEVMTILCIRCIIIYIYVA